jgi:hypothetical protein
MKRFLGLASVLLSLAALVLPACAKELRSLKLLYVADVGTPREQSFTEFFRKHVKSVDTVARHGFDPATAAGYDVVVLDWPQSEETREMRKLTSPLGPRERWGRPTVLLGSAGLNLAVAWQVKGGAGCTCMDPVAYGLREHEIFDAPMKIDRSKTTTIPTPEDFKDEIKAATIEVIPLVTDVKAHYVPGWCTYDYDFAANPDVEFFSGGVNHKTPRAAGLWRQGNLLHFGFEPSPAEMNQTGRELLLNSVTYISRFSEDRPIAVTASVFAGKRVAPSRASVAKRFRNPEVELTWTKEAFTAALLGRLNGKGRAELLAWAESDGRYLRPDDERRLELDDDLIALGVTFERPEFLDAVVRLLKGSTEEQARARRLVERYLPDAAKLDAEATVAWIVENRPYLFATDTGDYHWYVDPLAKRRGVPTVELRGPRRADPPAAQARAR